MQTNGTRDERPVGELVSELASQTSTLVRQELELARLELTQKGKAAGLGAGMLGSAGIAAWFGLGALTACAILALAEAMDAWLAAAIVSAAYFLVAAILALSGRSKVRQAAPLAPQQAIETTKEDVAVTKARVKEARS